VVQFLHVQEGIHHVYSVIGVFLGSAKSPLRYSGKLCVHLELESSA